MSTEKITNKIIQKAQAEADEIIKQAEKQAEEIVKQAQAEAEKLKKNALGEARELKEREIEKLLGMRNIEFRKEILAEKRKLIDSVFDKAVKKIKNEPEVYRKLVEKMIRSITFRGGETIIYSDDLTGKILKKNAKGKSLKFEKGDVEHGFIVRSGNIEMNFTVDLIMREASRELEAEVARILFEQ